jgi:prefoldin subunit 5
MAYSYFEVTASGGNTFNIPFDYIDQSEVSVYVDGVEASFTFTSAYVIDITPAPANGALVRIERATNLSERAVDFASGAVLTEEDLDKSNIQVYHAAQEALDKVEQTMQVDVDGKWEGQDRVIKNVADPVNDTDAVNRQFITTNLPAINRVHQSITAVDTVAADLNEAVSEIETVSDNITNVNIVGDAISNVNTTATHIANVNRVALSADNVDTVEASITNVDTTAGSIANVNNVGNNIQDVVTVSTNMTDVNTVANDIDKVIETANDLQEAVSEINTVAGNITNVNIVGDNIANVGTVAGISTDVTALVDRYYVQTTQPTSGMVQGDLWYSTSDNLLYTYTGTGWNLTTQFDEAMIRENNYVATADQTAFSGTDKNGYGMVLADGATTYVYQNGILIEPTIDYTIDFATATVTLVVGATLDDELRIIQINPFNSLEYNQLD